MADNLLTGSDSYLMEASPEAILLTYMQFCSWNEDDVHPKNARSLLLHLVSSLAVNCSTTIKLVEAGDDKIKTNLLDLLQRQLKTLKEVITNFGGDYDKLIQSVKTEKAFLKRLEWIELKISSSKDLWLRIILSESVFFARSLLVSSKLGNIYDGLSSLRRHISADKTAVCLWTSLQHKQVYDREFEMGIQSIVKHAVKMELEYIFECYARWLKITPDECFAFVASFANQVLDDIGLTKIWQLASSDAVVNYEACKKSTTDTITLRCKEYLDMFNSQSHEVAVEEFVWGNKPRNANIYIQPAVMLEANTSVDLIDPSVETLSQWADDWEKLVRECTPRSTDPLTQPTIAPKPVTRNESYFNNPLRDKELSQLTDQWRNFMDREFPSPNQTRNQFMSNLDGIYVLKGFAATNALAPDPHISSDIPATESEVEYVHGFAAMNALAPDPHISSDKPATESEEEYVHGFAATNALAPDINSEELKATNALAPDPHISSDIPATE